MHFSPPIEIGPLDDDARRAVRAVAEEAAAHDGAAPLSEQPLLNLAADGEWLTHVVARNPYGKTVGYVQVDRSGETASAELVVHPAHRGRGTGRLLLRTAERDATIPARSGVPGQHGKQLRVWAHGDLPVARSFAQRAGYSPVRELLFLARPLPASSPDGEGTTDAKLAAPPSGLRVRTFVPGRDEEAWLRANARAFATHPEQGRLTLDDLRARQAEPWFDPEGFFLLVPDDEAARDGEPGPDPVGFLWTKVEHGQPDGARDGEIYAVGIDPDHQGRGLGGVLTATALAYLARVGATRAVLYVEGDNAAALATYARAGFDRAGTHVQYART